MVRRIHHPSRKSGTPFTGMGPGDCIGGSKGTNCIDFLVPWLRQPPIAAMHLRLNFHFIGHMFSYPYIHILYRSSEVICEVWYSADYLYLTNIVKHGIIFAERILLQWNIWRLLAPYNVCRVSYPSVKPWRCTNIRIPKGLLKPRFVEIRHVM